MRPFCTRSSEIHHWASQHTMVRGLRPLSFAAGYNLILVFIITAKHGIITVPIPIACIDRNSSVTVRQIDREIDLGNLMITRRKAIPEQDVHFPGDL